MQGVIIETKRTVTISRTANQWELYSHLPGAQDAAIRLNETLEAAINGSDSMNEAITKIEPLLKELSNYGVSDSEPMWHIENLLNKVYGKEEKW